MSENQDAREQRLKEGIFLSPWLVSLAISVMVAITNNVYQQATTKTSIEALTSRVQRLESQIDSMNRRVAGQPSPPIAGGLGASRLWGRLLIDNVDAAP